MFLTFYLYNQTHIKAGPGNKEPFSDPFPERLKQTVSLATDTFILFWASDFTSSPIDSSKPVKVCSFVPYKSEPSSSPYEPITGSRGNPKFIPIALALLSMCFLKKSASIFLLLISRKFT